MPWRASLTRRVVAIAMMATGTMGCGAPSKTGPPRYPVTGTVTYAGKPLTAGRIAFEPDTKLGNKGPAAYGDIVNGRYETYRTMGAVGGPHRVVIEGYAGETPEQTRKMRPLFSPHITTIELPLEKMVANFSVPAAKAR